MIILPILERMQEQQDRKSELCRAISQECYKIAAKGNNEKAFAITPRLGFGDPFMSSSRVREMTPNDYANEGLRYETLAESETYILRTVRGLEAQLERLSSL